MKVFSVVVLAASLSLASSDQLNVLGKPLELCSSNPLTGYFRTGRCETTDADEGTHTICTIVSQPFLELQRSLGNDLITARAESKFPGLKHGDRWCLCALRWKQALDPRLGIQPPAIVLEASHGKSLRVLGMTLQELVPFATIPNRSDDL